MKSCLSNLVPLAILAAILASGLVPAYLAESIFEVDEKGAMAIGAGCLGLALYGLYRWLIAMQNKEGKVLSTLNDPTFGEVKQLRDSWEAAQPIVDGGASVEIFGYALSPTATQTSTFMSVRERWPALLAVCVEGANNLIESANGKSKKPAPSIKTDQLVLESVALYDKNAGNFTLTFDLPTNEKLLPWGVTVMFENFEVVEVSDNH